jgi:hypothetical protein
MISTPVLIIGYKRYRNILKLLFDLKSSGISKVYLALDGITDCDLNDRKTFLAELDDLTTKTGLVVEKWVRPKNLGPAVSIITAIDWFFSNEELGVILEDDLEIGSDTMPFFHRTLQVFRDNPRVGIITGSNFWDIGPDDFSWSSFPIIWGWATWKNRWEELRRVFFSTNADFLELGKLSEKLFWRVGLHRCLNGYQDAWDIPFASFFRNSRKICILPPVNLISNIGVDRFAGNTFENKWPLFQKICKFEASNNRSFQNHFKESRCLDPLILREIYSVTSKNILSGVLYFVFRPLAAFTFVNHNSLANRIYSVNIP